MGIDLKVMATSFRERPTEMLPTASVYFERDMRLLSLFSREATPCIVRPMPQELKIGNYEDNGLQFHDLDRYGRPLTWISSSDLKKLTVPFEISPWNRAVLAFLSELPDDRRIVLYWC